MKTIKKSDLPHKTCIVCRRPFSWRKKWKDCWDEVKYCSDRCRGMRPQKNNSKEKHE
ncbi:MAG TPA: DUF2256 domain-containing protein [Chitinophagaceae bacterium]|nr:DUF2256 domain-containing protein [Chitinophagaceae bacterium]HCY89414.1 DUF2256 domain-containing protein [Chitinophagaceae bacterium]HRF27353.1 DUF2256 domain-containing protein [Ferruginibacter sp.]